MASNIVLKTYASGDNNQGSVTPQNDALIYQCAVPMNGLFSGGTVTLSSANVLHIAAGFGIIGGRFFEVLESDISVQLSASGDLLGRLYIHLDLSNADNPISIETYTGASLPALTGDPNLNISSGAFDMELCTFDVNELTISNIVSKFPTITAANNQVRRATAYAVNDLVMCQSASDALIFICTTAGTTAVSEPVGYATVTAGNTVSDGTAVFKAVRFATLADQSLIAPVEINASSASQGYAIGEQFILNGLLSEATAAISQGNAFVLDGNYKLADSVIEQLNANNIAINTRFNNTLRFIGEIGTTPTKIKLTSSVRMILFAISTQTTRSGSWIVGCNTSVTNIGLKEVSGSNTLTLTPSVENHELSLITSTSTVDVYALVFSGYNNFTVE